MTSTFNALVSHSQSISGDHSVRGGPWWRWWSWWWPGPPWPCPGCPLCWSLWHSPGRPWPRPWLADWVSPRHCRGARGSVETQTWDPTHQQHLKLTKDRVYFLILDYLLIFFKINYLLLIFLLNWVGAVAVNISDITLVKVRSDAFLRWSDFMSRHQLWLRQSPSLASSPTAGFNRNRGENWFLLIKVSSEQDLITKCTAAV